MFCQQINGQVNPDTCNINNKENTIILKNFKIDNKRRRHTNPFVMVHGFTISIHTFLLLFVIVIYTHSIVYDMKYSTVAALVTTKNQRRLISMERVVRTDLFATTQLQKALSQGSPRLTMITDSRELRFLESCMDAKYAYSTSSGHSSFRQHSTNTSLTTNNSRPRAQRASAAKTKSTIEALEEMIAKTYSRALEENYEMVSTIFRPILSTTLSSHTAAYRSESNPSAFTESLHSGLFGSRLLTPTMSKVTAVQQQHAGKAAATTATTSKTSVRQYSSSDDPSRVSSSSSNGMSKHPKFPQHHDDEGPKRTGYGSSIHLTDDERELFQLLRRVRKEIHLSTTLRVAGGWVRDKLLATPEFQAYHKVTSVGKESLTQPPANNRLTTKFRKPAPSMGRQGSKILSSPRLTNGEHDFQPVDIDIALDDMLGREFADRLNEYLAMKGEETVSVGMVLKNPEKSKHLETATMKVNSFWIDFVNLRAEEYTQDSRIPDLMRIGTAKEDAFRRDLTINALFYNINTGEIEDFTGRGFDDLRKGIVSTPLPPLTTLLDDPLRALRSIRFAARLRFTMDNDLVKAAQNELVANALTLKVSRERVGGELDLMLRSPDPVGAIRLLINLKLIDCVFPFAKYLIESGNAVGERVNIHTNTVAVQALDQGLELLSTTNDHLTDCQFSPPVWCSKSNVDTTAQTMVSYGASEARLLDDEETRRLLWYSAFITPLYETYQQLQPKVSTSADTENQPKSKRSQSKRTNRSIMYKLLVDDLKRPIRDAEAVERIIKASDDFMDLLASRGDVSATMLLLSEVEVVFVPLENTFHCFMHGRQVDSCVEEDPGWQHAMEFRLLCSKVILRIGPLWRAALVLSIARELQNASNSHGMSTIQYAIEGDVIDESQEEWRQGIIERYDVFATALQSVGLIGIWNEKPIADGDLIRKSCLLGIPPGPAFRDVMDEQVNWMTKYPGGKVDALYAHLKKSFPDYVVKTTAEHKG